MLIDIHNKKITVAFLEIDTSWYIPVQIVVKGFITVMFIPLQDNHFFKD